jgi:outer membrane protein OmpA-like peptidoglycan-associated protein
MTVRDDIRKPEDLKGKTIALQLYGPHMDYVANVVTSAGLKPTDVEFRWFKELSLPTYDTKGAIVDPVSAFAASDKLGAVMCISPDAMNLTSKGKVGTGAEGSVKGAHILLSTKTASRIIADVYAVRKDYFEANRPQVQAMVHALLRGEEALRDLRAEKPQPPRYKQLLTRSAELLFGSAQATGDAEGLLGDCQFVGHPGNVAFFTGQGTTRNLTTLTAEIQAAFQAMGLMSGRVPLRWAEWDYTALAKGLKYSTAAPTGEALVAEGFEPAVWGEPGTLFMLEINFDPNQSTFASDKYAKDFQQALKFSQTYGGAVVVIEGHSDPMGIISARQKGVSDAQLAQLEQAAKNLSLMRANAVKQAYLEYCKTQKIVVDEAQFHPVGMGVKAPKFNPPKTREEWVANRRVVFRVKQIETELQDFQPPK